MNRVVALAGAALIAFGAGALLYRSRHVASLPTPAPEPATRVLTVAFSGEDLGHLEPCGCTPAMLGGLARRPARLRASAEFGVPSAFVSGGGLVGGSGDYDRMRLGTILSALQTMDCAAFAPSRRELALGLEALARTAGATGIPLVAANVDAPDAPPGLLRRYVPLRTGDLPVYAIGVCAPGAAGDGVVVTDPVAALRRIRGELPSGSALVVLADLDARAARALADGDTGPVVVLHTGGRTDPFDDDVTQGRTAVAPLPAKGKFVGLAHLTTSDSGAAWQIEYRPVLPDLPEDADVRRLKAAHLLELVAKDIVSEHAGDARFAVGAAPPEGARYAGEACAQCHDAEVRVWAASRHASAIESLSKTHDDADPDCVRCHVVGYGTGRGFGWADAPASLGSVGCEACHGPRAHHVEERRAGRADERGPAATERTCIACHDDEHDPQFDFAPYWARIAHGRK